MWKYLIIFLLAISAVQVSHAAIALDGLANTSNSSLTALFLNWTHTVNSNTNGILVVATHIWEPLVGNAANVTYNGILLTHIRNDSDTVDGRGETALWYLLNPPVGTGNVEANFVGGTSNGVVGFSLSFTGVDQASPIDAHTGTGTPGTTVTTLSTSITTTTANSVIVDSIHVGGGITLTMGAQTNRTERFNVALGQNSAISTVMDKSAPGSQTMNWILSGGRRGGLSVVALKPAPANSCTYTSGNWLINCADACVLSSNINLGGNNIVFSGPGVITITGIINNFLKAVAVNSCRVAVMSGGRLTR